MREIRRHVSLCLCLLVLLALSGNASAAGLRVTEQREYFTDQGIITDDTDCRRTTFQYDAAGKLARKTVYDIRGDEERLYRDTLYSYQNGRLSRCFIVSNDYWQRGVFVAHYDGAGRLIEIQTDQYTKDFYDIFNDFGLYIGAADEDGTVQLAEAYADRVKEEYDSAGRILSLTASYRMYKDEWTSEEMLSCLMTCKYQYDESGRILAVLEKTETQNPDGKEPTIRYGSRLFSYREDGTYTCYCTGETPYEYTMEGAVEFNAAGWPIRCTCYNEGIYDRLQVVSFQYDSHGIVTNYEKSRLADQRHSGEQEKIPEKAGCLNALSFEVETDENGLTEYSVYGWDPYESRRKLWHHDSYQYNEEGLPSELKETWYAYGGLEELCLYEYDMEPWNGEPAETDLTGMPDPRHTPYIHSAWEHVS